MQNDTDYLSFLDGTSRAAKVVDKNAPPPVAYNRVPYHQSNAGYSLIPHDIIETIEFDYKLYYKTSTKYYVGTRLSKYVRSITAQDYKYIKSRVTEEEEKNKVSSKGQLFFDFC